MKSTLTMLAVLAILASAATPAMATPILWTLQNVSYQDGTQVTGSFVYDADTNIYSLASFTTSGGTSVPAASSWVIDPYPIFLGNDGFVAVDSVAADLTGAHVFSLFSGLPLTNSGGTLPIDLYGIAGTCGDFQCSFVSSLVNYSYWADGGAFVSQGTVPEPGTLMLLGSGLVAGVLRRKFAR